MTGKASYIADALTYQLAGEPKVLKILAGNLDGSLTVHDIESNASQTLNIGFSGPILSTVSGLGSQMFTTGIDENYQIRTKIIDIENGVDLLELKVSDFSADRVLLDPDKQWLAVSTSDGRVWWLNLEHL